MWIHDLVCFGIALAFWDRIDTDFFYIFIISYVNVIE